MPRKRFEVDPAAYYHITSRSINKDWFGMNLNEAWEIMSEELYFIKHAFNLKIFSFVLMNNHYHLLIRAPEGNLSNAMCFFQSQTSRRIVKSQGRINHLWVRRFKRTKIKEFHYLFNTYKYIYQNPVRAGVTKKCESYPYSTLRGLIGIDRLLIPIENDPIFFEFYSCISDYFKWINELPDKEAIESMRSALKRPNFKYPRECGRKNRLESESY